MHHAPLSFPSPITIPIGHTYTDTVTQQRTCVRVCVRVYVYTYVYGVWYLHLCACMCACTACVCVCVCGRGSMCPCDLSDVHCVICISTCCWLCVPCVVVALKPSHTPVHFVHSSRHPHHHPHVYVQHQGQPLQKVTYIQQAEAEHTCTCERRAAWQIRSCHVMSCHAMGPFVLDVISCRVMSVMNACPFMSCHVHVLSQMRITPVSVSVTTISPPPSPPITLPHTHAIIDSHTHTGACMHW